MNNFAKQIHKRYHIGCLEIINSAIKLLLPFEDILTILYFYNQAFKSPFLDKQEFFIYTKDKPFGEVMEELFMARDFAQEKMNKELLEIESHLSVWKKDSYCKLNNVQE